VPDRDAPLLILALPLCDCSHFHGSHRSTTFVRREFERDDAAGVLAPHRFEDYGAPGAGHNNPVDFNDLVAFPDAGLVRRATPLKVQYDEMTNCWPPEWSAPTSHESKSSHRRSDNLDRFSERELSGRRESREASSQQSDGSEQESEGPNGNFHRPFDSAPASSVHFPKITILDSVGSSRHFPQFGDNPRIAVNPSRLPMSEWRRFSRSRRRARW